MKRASAPGLPEAWQAAVKEHGRTEMVQAFERQYAENPFVRVLADALAEAVEKAAAARARCRQRACCDTCSCQAHRTLCIWRGQPDEEE